jgi:C-terminal processing protease CtpA/Prc
MEAALVELETHYGMPPSHKEKEFGITLERLRRKYTRLIKNATTLEEDFGWEVAQKRDVLSFDQFQQLMIGMIGDLKDGHANMYRQSQDYYTLGLFAAAIEGRLFVTGFNKDLFPLHRASKEIRVGDEIIAVDGEPIQKVAERLRIYSQTATFESKNNFGLEATTSRSRAFFPEMKEGLPVTLTFKRGSTQFDGFYNWFETSAYRNAKSLSPLGFDSETALAWDEAIKVPFGTTGAVSSYFRTGLDSMNLPMGSEYDIGALLNSELEIKNKTLAEKEKINPVKRLMASVLRQDGTTYGILRIPNYSSGSYAMATNEIKWIAEILKRMENAVDVLIVDQVSNGGGFVFYVGALASLLAGETPMKSMTLNLRLSETLIHQQYSVSGVNSDPYTGKKNNWGQNRLRQLHAENLAAKWKAKEQWSGPVAMFQPDTQEGDYESGVVIPSDKVSFTKPILILNDNRSASGGDFFPSLMQANGRAIIMGETSKGLGGPVYRSVDSLPGSEMSFRCTMGFCLRPDGLPMENLGVPPDIVRPVRPEDLTESFKSYSGDVLIAAKMIAEKKDVKMIKERFRESIEKLEINLSMETKDALNVTKAEVEKFQKLPRIEKIDNDFESVPPKLVIKMYEGLFELVRLADSTLPPESLRGLVLPLPKSLIKKDIFLSSLWRREEFLNRLEEMQGLPEWRQHKDILNALAIGLRSIKGPIWIGHPCELLLFQKD